MADGTVEITESGRGGSIVYCEDRVLIRFAWEFAAPPALVYVFGSPARAWDEDHPGARGRQAEIYDSVCAEIVRQKAPGSLCKIDLEDGTITVMQPMAARPTPVPAATQPSPGYACFLASRVPPWQSWPEDRTYDVAALATIDPAERAAAVALLTAGTVTWREVEALAAIDTPAARAAVDAALGDHLSIDTRLAAAAAMHRQGRLADFDGVLAREIRALSRPANGLALSLRLAAEQPNETVRQALLWASWNDTDCAPACAELLLRLTGNMRGLLDAEEAERILAKLSAHGNAFDRMEGFEALCRRAGMVLDPGE